MSLEAQIQELNQNIVKLIGALAGGAKVADTPAKAAPAPTKPAPEKQPAKAETAPADKAVTYDDVKAAVQKFGAAKGGTEVGKLLKEKFNLDHCKNAKPEQWPEIVKVFREGLQ